MRNRALHDALRDFALEAAALLSEEVRDGAELEFDVVDERRRNGPVLYRYEPRTSAFIAARWSMLRERPTCTAAAAELGAGAAAWLRVNGLRGEQAEPALRAMLERLYEDAANFGFPEERFERLYREVETTLYRDSVHTLVLAPLLGVVLEPERVELGGGLSLVRGEHADAPPEVVWPENGEGEPAALCVLERDVPPGEQLPAAEAEERFRELVTALRLFKPGAVSLGAPGWRRAGDGRWAPVALGGPATARGAAWTLTAGEGHDLREFLAALEETTAGGTVAWALARFEMGCERDHDSEALSDYLLALRGLLEATGDAGEASLALRVAALCAEDGRRRAVQRRVEATLSLERFVMGGGGSLAERIGSESPRELVAEIERDLRALLRDVLCGYLDADLKGVADDILLESQPEPFQIEARDLRRQAAPEAGTSEVEARDLRERRPAPEADTSEFEPVAATAAPPSARQLDGVTPSDDWSWDPEDYSAPV
jgi:hypothetical protein